MNKPNEDELKALVNIQTHRDWPTVERWLRGCSEQTETSMVYARDDEVYRYQGKSQAFRFILKHIMDAKLNLNSMRENPA